MAVGNRILYEKVLSTNKGRVLLTTTDRDAKLGNVDDGVDDLDVVNVRQLKAVKSLKISVKGQEVTNGVNFTGDIVLTTNPDGTITAEIVGGDGVSNHNLLTNLQGGTPETNTYIHLTQQEYDDLLELIDNPPQSLFTTDLTVSLSGGKTAGKYTSGQTIPRIGKTNQEVMDDMFVEYINPAWNSFNISGQPTTLEVGSTLSGVKPFTWSIAVNSAIVPTIDIFDVTTNTVLLAATTNDGSQSVTINTRQLNSNGTSQSWRGVGNNTNPSGPSTFNSGNFTVTARFLLFHGALASNPSDSASVRALTSSAFYTGATTIQLNTGATFSKFAIALPTGVTITQVIDLDALNANITSEYILTGTVNVLDAGGTSRVYNLYVMTQAVPYSSSHRHNISIS